MTDVDSRDKAGRTALHYAANSNGRELDELRALLASGADIEATDDSGWRPLHFAAQKGSVDVVEMLVEAGATIDSTNNKGDTPLGVATASPHSTPEVLRCLRAHGADPYHENERGKSPIGRLTTFTNLPEKTAVFSDLIDDDGKPKPR